MVMLSPSLALPLASIWLPPVDPLAGWPARDRHRQLLDPGRPVVVTRREVRALVRTPGLLAGEPRPQDALPDVDEVLQLQGADQLGVEGPAGVADADGGHALAECLEG